MSSKAPFIRLLPQSLSTDKTMADIAGILEPVLAAGDAAIASILVMARLMENDDNLAPPLARIVEQAGGLAPLEDDLLDLLAWQFHVDGYETANTTELKRQMVLESIMMHRRKGTPWAVRNALEHRLERSVEVREWWKCGDPAYWFRIAFDTSADGLSQDQLADVWRLIAVNKNVRSWCKSLDLTSSVSVPAVIHATIVEHIRSSFHLSFPHAAPHVPVQVLGAVITISTTRSELHV